MGRGAPHGRAAVMSEASDQSTERLLTSVEFPVTSVSPIAVAADSTRHTDGVGERVGHNLQPSSKAGEPETKKGAAIAGAPSLNPRCWSAVRDRQTVAPAAAQYRSNARVRSFAISPELRPSI
jgi:hypothetical protein